MDARQEDGDFDEDIEKHVIESAAYRYAACRQHKIMMQEYCSKMYLSEKFI